MKKYLILLFLAALTMPGCSSDYTILPSIGQVLLTADSSSRTYGEIITFTAKDIDGTDFTQETEFYVNGSLIEGNTFTSEVAGTFTVTAKYEGIESSPIVIEFHDGSQINFVKRLLVEDYTGTWCGWCPRVAHAIEMLHAQTENAVTVAIHRASSNVSSPSYDPYNYDSSDLEDIIDEPGYPKGLLNRMTLWESLEPEHLGQAIALTQGENPKLGLALSPVINGNNITLDVNVKFSKDFSNLKLVVYVLENGLIHNQHNYTTYYNGASVITGYEHNHVLRAVLTSLLGDPISNSETLTGNTFTRNFSVSMPANITNTAKVEFVAFIIDAQGNALNVRKAASGDAQEFEIL